MKFLIQQRFRLDIHYVWCSESFDASANSRYSPLSMVPPSSNPADIYKQLKQDVERKDNHSYKIAEQKASQKKLAIDWHHAGEISAAAKDEIIYMVDNSPFDYWRPLLYLIPRINVETRIKIVPIQLRAGLANEYILPDLNRSEFDIIEL